MKTFHEAPIYYMDAVDRVTDGTYFLVHLFQENDEYLDRALKLGGTARHTILDNSVFELETAFDSEAFAGWINITRPTEYIIPDVLEDADQTIQNVIDWNKDFKKEVYSYCKTIGVVQGKTYEDVVRCYKAIEPLVDKVAISFDYSFWTKERVFNGAGDPPKDKLELWKFGRRALIERLQKDGVINRSKPHHLLGASIYDEFQAYQGLNWIDSVDTSSPVMWAMEKKLYTNEIYKPKTKLFTLIDYTPESIEEDLDITTKMLQNIATFRKVCNG